MRDKEGRLGTFILKKTIRVYNKAEDGAPGRIGMGRVVFYAPNEFIVLEPPEIKEDENKAEEDTMKQMLIVQAKTIVPLEDLKNITILD